MNKLLKNNKLRYVATALIVFLSFFMVMGFIFLTEKDNTGETLAYVFDNDDLYVDADAIVLNSNDNLFYAKIGDNYYLLQQVAVLFRDYEEDAENLETYTIQSQGGTRYICDNNKSNELDLAKLFSGESQYGKLIGIGDTEGNLYISNYADYNTEYIFLEESIPEEKIVDVSEYIAAKEKAAIKEAKERKSKESSAAARRIFAPNADKMFTVTFIIVILLSLFCFVSKAIVNAGRKREELSMWDRMAYSVLFCILLGVGFLGFVPYFLIERGYSFTTSPALVSFCAAASVTILCTGWLIETTIARIASHNFIVTTTIYYLAEALAKPIGRLAEKSSEKQMAKRDLMTGCDRIAEATGKIVAGELDAIDLDAIPERYKAFAKDINDIALGKTQAVEDMLRSERMKTELITNVSHDIKTPLTSIISYTDLLSKEDIKGKNAKEYLEVIDSQSKRLKVLLEDLIEASKASSGAIPVNMEELDLAIILPQIISEYQDKLEEKKLTVVTSIPKEEVKVTADGKHLSRVLCNVFSNVCKYSLEGTRVYVDVVPGEQTKISIKNTSEGELNISPEELKERFTRGDMSRTKEGSGLGLSIAESLMNLMDGNLDIEIDGDLFKVIITL